MQFRLRQNIHGETVQRSAPGKQDRDDDSTAPRNDGAADGQHAEQVGCEQRKLGGDTGIESLAAPMTDRPKHCDQ